MVHNTLRTDGSAQVHNASVLVTGGFGFIGAWFTTRLLGRGNRIVLLDNGDYENSTAAALGLADHADVSVSVGDICSADTFQALAGPFDYIVHAAGFLGIHKVVEHPISTLEINIMGTKRCLEFAAKQPSLQRLIIFSTSEVYGPQAVDARESHPAVVHADSLRWGYAASKLAGEFLAMGYVEEFSVPAAVVRPFNVYGPYRRGTNAVTALTDRALRGEPLVVSGDGEQRRSWCYITDFVDGIERLLLSPDGTGECVNLGNDRTDLSLLELAQLIVERTDSTSTILVAGGNVPDVQERKPVLDKARSLLGYNPVVDMATGIAAVATARREELERARAAIGAS
ncbi:NAD-dependent epimerase/dehydratase family protein [Streptomyces anulatus]|uniref:NAD-dependent epimerase/dehydratase family protein n=1 Tax=Streptomyces anulatus TaxID=1892 RepID=UPI003862DA3C